MFPNIVIDPKDKVFVFTLNVLKITLRFFYYGRFLCFFGLFFNLVSSYIAYVHDHGNDIELYFFSKQNLVL